MRDPRRPGPGAPLVKTVSLVAAAMFAAPALTVLGAPAAGAEPATASDVTCATGKSETAIAAGTPMLDWAENLAYDAQGNLWVTRLYGNSVQRYDKSGARTASVPVESPGAVRLGPDGLMYVVSGDSPSSFLRPGSVLRFDPAAPDRKPELFATGFAMPNGAAFDARGNLYVAATGAGVTRIRRDGAIDTAWSERAKYLGVNGIAIRGNWIYLTANAGPLGQVLRLPIEDPGSPAVLAELTSRIPGIPDFADDLVLDESGTLTVSTLSGQLVRVDPERKTTCTILTGTPMTSVALVPGRSDQLVAGTEEGVVLRVTLPR